jgi:cyclophilin family peptidyl-prolyl cis-trans isomerase
MAQLTANYPEDVRFVYRHFPLASIHDKALLAAQAAEAAGLQGKFWEMHDFLFANFNTWARLPADQFPGWVMENAADLDLDMDQFEADLTSDAVVAIAQGAWDYGQQIGIPGTPLIAINNIPYQGSMDYASFERIIEANKLTDNQYTACPPMVIDPLKQYIATIETAKGKIVLELFPDVAPMTVNSFVFLAREGWFDGVTFHRVLPGFMAQGGDPSGSGMGGPGYAFKNETSPDLTFDRAGLLAMANSGPDTNGSQFFITYGPASHLDGSYTIFGEVLEGMEVVEALTPRDPSQGSDLPPGDIILKITIEEK